jgi:hypothetical protein
VEARQNFGQHRPGHDLSPSHPFSPTRKLPYRRKQVIVEDCPVEGAREDDKLLETESKEGGDRG